MLSTLDYLALVAVPGGEAAGVNPASPALPALGWAPDNGQPGQAAVYVDAAQNFARRPAVVGPNPYPPTIGWAQQLLPLVDIWTLTGAVARLPASGWLGTGDYPLELGGTDYGLGASDARFLKVDG